MLQACAEIQATTPDCSLCKIRTQHFSASRMMALHLFISDSQVKNMAKSAVADSWDMVSPSFVSNLSAGWISGLKNTKQVLYLQSRLLTVCFHCYFLSLMHKTNKIICNQNTDCVSHTTSTFKNNLDGGLRASQRPAQDSTIWASSALSARSPEISFEPSC